MVQVRIPGVTQSNAAKPIVKALVDGAPAPERAALVELLGRAAKSDGNRVLGSSEAALVRDAYDAAKTPAGVDLGALTRTASEQIDARLASRDLDGIRPYFTATTADINRIIIGEFRETIAAARGRPVDFNIMIFSFVDPEIGDAMLDLARENPNVNFRIIADFGQTSTTGNRQPPRLDAEAKRRGLDDQIHVKFKKDAPFVWSDRAGRPVYNHSSTKGLNHHKGFVALIDGQPHKLVTGSYNWSKTADDKNYEDLFVLDATNPANRGVMGAYQAEFVAFYNHEDTLNLAQAKRHKSALFSDLRVANGRPPLALGPVPPASEPYVPVAPGAHVDVNDASDASTAKLRALVGDSRVHRAIVSAYANHGRFASLEDLMERVPSVRRLSDAKKAELEANLEFGDGRVLLQAANVDELVRGLKISRNLALAIVAKRNEVGDFESVDQLRELPGMTAAIFDRVAPRLNDDVARMYFSARPFSAAEAARGYAAENANRKVPVMSPNGVVAEQDAALSAGVKDLLARAKPGDLARIGMYGMSVNTPEFAAIVEAANRGVQLKVLLNDDHNEGPAAALAALAAQGKPIEVRIQKARTMHQKFGVLNDDSFFGTANMSGSSASKHSEDRVVVKNNADVAAKMVDNFELIWARSRAV
ncbi:phospholipase D-like domain-containing protein [Myxococcota bacterium]|nr:phospholipase D-like domain-containing protein [Myxococcota bacterium]